MARLAGKPERMGRGRRHRWMAERACTSRAISWRNVPAFQPVSARSGGPVARCRQRRSVRSRMRRGVRSMKHKILKPGSVVLRAEAKLLGLSQYFTGKPCINGHAVERFTANGCCITCAAQRTLAWRIANPEKSRGSSLQWKEENLDYVRASYSNWQKNNKKRRSATQALRRARKVGSGDSYSASDVERLYEQQKGRCAHSWCKKKLNGKYHVDHRTPLFRGGSNGPKNIQLLCPRCNLKKSAKDPIKWANENWLLL